MGGGDGGRGGGYAPFDSAWPPLGGGVLRLLQVQLFLEHGTFPDLSGAFKRKKPQGEASPFPGDLWVPPLL